MFARPVTLALLRFHASTAGAAALRRALPLALGIVLVSAILFGPTGIQPREVLAAAETSAGIRAAIWGAWVGLAALPARALFDTPSSWMARTWPVSQTAHAALAGAWLLAFASPWFAFFCIGKGPLAALEATTIVIALELGVAAGFRGALETAITLALFAGVVAGAPLGVIAGFAALASWPLFVLAFARGPERGASRSKGRGIFRVSGSPTTALAAAHALAVGRGEPLAFHRGAAFVVVGAICSALAARNGRFDLTLDALSPLALGVGAPAIALASAAVTSPVLEADRVVEWLVLSTATTPRHRALARIATPIALGASSGLLFAIVAGVLEGAPFGIVLSLALTLFVWGAGIGAAVSSLARGAEKKTGVDRSGVLLRALLVGATGATIGATLGVVGTPVVVALAAFVIARDVQLAERARTG